MFDARRLEKWRELASSNEVRFFGTPCVYRATPLGGLVFRLGQRPLSRSHDLSYKLD